jgi:hypothetical protein
LSLIRGVLESAQGLQTALTEEVERLDELEFSLAEQRMKFEDQKHVIAMRSAQAEEENDRLWRSKENLR